MEKRRYKPFILLMFLYSTPIRQENWIGPDWKPNRPAVGAMHPDRFRLQPFRGGRVSTATTCADWGLTGLRRWCLNTAIKI